jgi:hypothetical protein
LGGDVHRLKFSSLSAVFTSSVGPESTIFVALLCVWPIIIEATKSLNKGGKESVPIFPWNEPWKA